MVSPFVLYINVILPQTRTLCLSHSLSCCLFGGKATTFPQRQWKTWKSHTTTQNSNSYYRPFVLLYRLQRAARHWQTSWRSHRMESKFRCFSSCFFASSIIFDATIIKFVFFLHILCTLITTVISLSVSLLTGGEMYDFTAWRGEKYSNRKEMTQKMKSLVSAESEAKINTNTPKNKTCFLWKPLGDPAPLLFCCLT